MSRDLSSFLTAVDLPSDAVEVAYIGHAWGVKGGFKVHTHNDIPEAIRTNHTWYIKLPKNLSSKNELAWLLRINKLKQQGDTLLAHSSAISDRTTAEYLCNARVLIPRSQFPELDQEEYYWIDLIGCEVYNLEGVYLGVVRDLLSSSAQTTLVLVYGDTKQKEHERLIPFVSAIVQEVDTKDKIILADWQQDY